MDFKLLCSKIFNKEVIYFGIIGIIGFIVDAGFLLTLKGIIGLYVAKVISFILAVITTWLLNRKLTFKKSPSGMAAGREVIRYFSVMLIGGAANYLAFYCSTKGSLFIYNNPILGVAIGSIIGMLFNFTLSKMLIFRSI